MALALLAARRRAGLPLAAAATLGTVLVCGLAYRTGQAGGALVYEYGAARVAGSDEASSPRDDG